MKNHREVKPGRRRSEAIPPFLDHCSVRHRARNVRRARRRNGGVSPSGVTPTLLARGTYAEFGVRSVPDSPVDFQVKAKSPVDVVVPRHDYAIGSHTGWHDHRGPVFITVTQGTLTYYLYDDRPARRTGCRRPTGSSTTRADTWSVTNPASPHKI